jgi:hypothetical protein
VLLHYWFLLSVQFFFFSFCTGSTPSCAWILHTHAAFWIHPTSLPKSPSFLGSTCEFIPGLILPSSLFYRWSFMILFLAPCHFCTVGCPYSEGGELISRSTVSLGPNFLDDVSFSPCPFCMAGHLLSGGSRLPPGSQYPRPFLRLLAAIHGQILDPTPLPQSSNRHTAASPLGIF